jgi:hypothetical protein
MTDRLIIKFVKGGFIVEVEDYQGDVEKGFIPTKTTEVVTNPRKLIQLVKEKIEQMSVVLPTAD